MAGRIAGSRQQAKRMAVGLAVIGLLAGSPQSAQAAPSSAGVSAPGSGPAAPVPPVPFLAGYHIGGGSYQVTWDLPAQLAGSPADPSVIVSISGYPYQNPANFLTPSTDRPTPGSQVLTLTEKDALGQPVPTAPTGTFRVGILLADGTGAYWESEVEINIGAPSKLTELAARPAGPDLVEVTWSEPSYATAGQPSAVRLQCVVGAVVTATTTAAPIPASGVVTCGSGGRVRASAANPAGWGATSELPGLATGLTVNPTGATTAQLTWSGTDAAQAGVESDPQVTTSALSANAASVTSIPNAVHQLAVRRTNTDGRSISAPITWAVAPAPPTLMEVTVVGQAFRAKLLPSPLNSATTAPVVYQVYANGEPACVAFGLTAPAIMQFCNTPDLSLPRPIRFTATANSTGGTSVASNELLAGTVAPPGGGQSPTPHPSAIEPTSVTTTPTPSATTSGPAGTEAPAEEPVGANAPRLILSRPAASRASMSVTVSPARIRSHKWRIELQRKVDGAWQTVAQAATAGGRAKFGYQASGEYRVVAPVQSGSDRGVSAALTYRAAGVTATAVVTGQAIMLTVASRTTTGTKAPRVRYKVQRRSPWTGKWATIGTHRIARASSATSQNRIPVRGGGQFRIVIPNQSQVLGYSSPIVRIG